MDGQNFFIILDLQKITGLSWKEVLPQEKSAIKREHKFAFDGCGSDEHPDPDFTFHWKQATNDATQNEVEKCRE